jgi:hypothetical protein
MAEETPTNNTILQEAKKPHFSEVLRAKMQQRWQIMQDRMAPLVAVRWVILAVMLGVYGFRVWRLQGFFIITYALGIFLLNLFIGFLSPVSDVDGDGPMLPVNTGDEFKPFVRRLPEFKFW